MNQLWTMICLAGLWGFVFATAGFILKAFPARGTFDGRRAWPWGVVLVVCFIVWMVGMMRA